MYSYMYFFVTNLQDRVDLIAHFPLCLLIPKLLCMFALFIIILFLVWHIETETMHIFTKLETCICVMGWLMNATIDPTKSVFVIDANCSNVLHIRTCNITMCYVYV